MRRPPSKLVQRLVSASEEVLRPDRALRLEDIATLIGSARATLYYHFSGRDDLVAFLLEEHLRVAAETIELAVTTTRPPVVQLRSAITALVGFLGGQPGVCAGLLSFAGATARVGTLMAAKDTKLAAPLRKLLDEGAPRGQRAGHGARRRTTELERSVASMIRPLRLRRLQRANEHLRLPCHDHLRRQPPGPNVADQARHHYDANLS